MIEVLCYACSTHIANTDVARLDWPLTGEMFDSVFPGWRLRPGPLNLDIFCPACGTPEGECFPFSHDPYVSGGNAVGKNLNIRGADGKPVIMTVKQILMSNIGWKQLVPELQAPVSVPDLLPAFPCPACGAKKRFHKKGCSAEAELNQMIEDKKNRAFKRIISLTPEELALQERPQPQAAAPQADPHLRNIEARLSAADAPGDTLTPRELADLEQGRVMHRPEPRLRPAEGYQPKAAE